jgi:hypothetical protein
MFLTLNKRKNWHQMKPNANTFILLHIKNALNKLGLRRCWSHTVKDDNTNKLILQQFTYGDSRIFPKTELRKEFYEGL